VVEEILDLTLETIPGITPRAKEKLKENSVETLLDLASASPSDIEEILGGKEGNAAALILSARKLLEESGLLEGSFVTAAEVLDRRQAMMRCTTGSKGLDELLQGGIETQAITEVYGDFGSGKTQLCHTLCCNCQLPPERGGFGGSALYIDTETTFRPERIKQIADSRGMNANEILQNIVICRVMNSSHLELIIKTLGKSIEKFKARLVIVDSIISLHRAEFIGRGTLAERQQRLNTLIHRLIRQAEVYNVAVVVSNQVQTQPDVFFGDPTKPTGGNVIAHACTYRIYLKKAGQERIATIVDSPYHPYSETRFKITEKGVDDLESSRKSREDP